VYPYAAAKSLAELAVAGAGSPGELDFTIVRLPRVLGTCEQTRDATDILVSMVDACAELGTYPSVTLTEEVTTGHDAARRVLDLLLELGGGAGLGRGITVVRGQHVTYPQLLSEYAGEELDLVEWKHRLDRSDWAKRNPARWSIIDVWAALVARLGTRTYEDYFSDFPTIALDVESTTELPAAEQPIRPLLESGRSRRLVGA
jgi:thioester reductase-like protein